MGQLQPREAEGKRQEGAGGAVKHDLKDRVNASFQKEHEVNPAFGRGGSGSKANPGKPT